MSAKVELLREPWTSWHNSKCGPRPVPLASALPYYVTRYRRVATPLYVHRLRSGLLHFDKDRNTDELHARLTYRLWCGQQGSSTHGRLFAHPLTVTKRPTDEVVVCATCEARALANGYASSLTAPDEPPLTFRPRAASGSKNERQVSLNGTAPGSDAGVAGCASASDQLA